MTAVDVARLEALAERATPGPWSFDGPCQDEAEYGHVVLGGGVPGSMEEHQVAWLGETLNLRAPEDAEFIAALRNAAPSLFADHRAVERVRALCEDVERGWADLTRVDLSHTGSPAVMVHRIRAALGGAE